MKPFAWFLVAFIVFLLVNGRLSEYFALMSGGENG